MSVPKEHILSLVGYDKALLVDLSASDRSSLRAAGIAWLVACTVLGGAAAYAAHLVVPSPLSPALAGLGITLLMVNLLRILTSGGGCQLRKSMSDALEATAGYRPSLIPAAVFGVMAALLSQPAQLPLWPEIDREVEVHRAALMESHQEAALELGVDPEIANEELLSAGFPIFRLKRMWQDPKRALRWTAVICLLVLFPAFWSQSFALKARRSYELLRYQRDHAAAAAVQEAGRRDIAIELRKWAHS